MTLDSVLRGRLVSHSFPRMKLLPRIAALFLAAAFAAYAGETGTDILPAHTLAAAHYGNDAPWYEANIPFFECSDPEITAVYYYRWEDYKAHIRDLGDRGGLVTEFLNDVPWAIRPTQSLDDATAFHIHEGRWLADPSYVDDYIDYMYAGGGNDRHFSESIADAVYANYLVRGDRQFVIKHLDAMERIFHQWDDHYDFTKDLYFIEPLLDATEYTISSIDATGGKDGFFGGNAFRPTINSFMFANAAAISKIATLAGDAAAAKSFADTAAAIRSNVETKLWNDGMQHFVDRYQVSNQFVHYWDFIRGRELAGYVPWYYELPGQDPKYVASWHYLLSSDDFAGPHGLRTVEPSYQYYMKQYRYDKRTGQPECQWNGASWPFDTTLVLGGMANLLNDYLQNIVTNDDYVRLLKQYAHQHYLNGKLDIQEDYNPDTGNVIVGLARSHHYNHSGYDDLVITGLAGLRPRADNTLEVNPLIPGAKSPNPISYLCLENVHYHGQLVTILYDSDGTHYGKGAGLSVYVNGRQIVAPSTVGKKMVQIDAPATVPPEDHPLNVALNLKRSGFPSPSASINTRPGVLYAALDGRVWYFPEMPKYWTSQGSTAAQDWYAVDFGTPKLVRTVKLYFYSDGARFNAPASFSLQDWNGTEWVDIPNAKIAPAAPIGNGENVVSFQPMQISRLRVTFVNHPNSAIALVQLKAS
jgi:hypothetical protein